MFKLTKERRKQMPNKIREVYPEKLRGEYIKQQYKNGIPINNDEFYTTKEQVEETFRRIDKKQFEGKIIYSFCDDDESYWVKYIKANKNKLKYKEYIYTSDDYNNHIDLFEMADIVITNPPFSKIIKEIIPILKKTKCKYLLFGSGMHLDTYFNLDNSIISYGQFKSERIYDVPYIYKETDKCNEYLGYVCLFGNLKKDEIYENQCIRDELEKLTKTQFNLYVKLDDVEYPAIDFVRHYVKYYDCWCYAPVTAIHWNIFDFKNIKPKTVEYSDGIQNRFKRILIKMKHVI